MKPSSAATWRAAYSGLLDHAELRLRRLGGEEIEDRAQAGFDPRFSVAVASYASRNSSLPEKLS
jgi:hypothetical protein